MGTLVNQPAGSTLVYSIHDAAPLIALNRQTLATIFVILGGLLIIGAIVLFVLDRRKDESNPQPENTPSPEERIQALTKQIAELDNRYEAGQIKKAVYERDRQRLKRELANLMKSQTPQET
jgi:hypothetical protein